MINRTNRGLVDVTRCIARDGDACAVCRFSHPSHASERARGRQQAARPSVDPRPRAAAASRTGGHARSIDLMAQMNIDERVDLGRGSTHPTTMRTAVAVLEFFDAFARGDGDTLRTMLTLQDQMELEALIAATGDLGRVARGRHPDQRSSRAPSPYGRGVCPGGVRRSVPRFRSPSSGTTHPPGDRPPSSKPRSRRRPNMMDKL